MAKKKVTTECEDSLVDNLRDKLCQVVNIAASATTSFTPKIVLEAQSLSMQYALGMNGFPYGLLIELCGQADTCKSTILYEFMRWVLQPLDGGPGGKVVLFETEGKDNGALRSGLYNYDEYSLNNTMVVMCTSYEQWMDCTTRTFTHYQKFFENNTQFPVIVAVDSLMAAPTDKQAAEIDESGHTAADFPRLQKAISDDFKNFPRKLQNLPLLFMFVNHVREETKGLVKVEVSKGGRAPEYYKSISLKFSPAAKNGRFTKTNCEGRTIRMTLSKNSLGSKSREIEIIILYRYIENPSYDPDSFMSSPYILSVVFDWGEADIKFLQKVIAGSVAGFSTERRKRIADVLDLHVVSKQNSPTWCWSTTLGIPESDPVSFSEAGRMLMKNSKLLRTLQDELFIQRYPVFKRGDNFQDLLEICAREQSRLVQPKEITNMEEI